jgi:hypothetical protein
MLAIQNAEIEERVRYLVAEQMAKKQAEEKAAEELRLKLAEEKAE